MDKFERLAAKRPARIDRVVTRAADAISRALDQMVAALPADPGLPADAIPQMALELLVRRLVPRQPSRMQLLFEDHDLREAYYDAVAAMPARGGAKP
jgi:hypothetical protein